MMPICRAILNSNNDLVEALLKTMECPAKVSLDLYILNAYGLGRGTYASSWGPHFKYLLITNLVFQLHFSGQILACCKNKLVLGKEEARGIWEKIL